SYIAAGTGLTFHLSMRYGWKRNKNALWVFAEKLPNPPAVRLPNLPPFQGGFGVLFGYELGRAFEVLPQAEFDEFEAPEWAYAVYDWVISFDHRQGRAWIVSTGRRESLERG